MTRPMLMFVVLVVCAVALAMLSGCGGGGDQPQADQAPDGATNQPVFCTLNPKACI